jgi:hypothetical protein
MSVSSEHDLFRRLLECLAAELRRGDEPRAARSVEDAAAGSSEQRITFLQSNELWGGPGSIADQAGLRLERGESRRRIERALRDLGLEQLRLGVVNARTAIWVKTFSRWVAEGI